MARKHLEQLPIWQNTDGPEHPGRASDLVLKKIPVDEGRWFVERWHSRLPYLQRGPWKYVFGAFQDLTLCAVAFWHNPSARALPDDWLELRRMAVCDSAPRFTASWMLGAMERWFRRNAKDVERLFSYQDMAVHSGTIYKASNWTPTYVSRPRRRDRSKPRRDTTRRYRSDSNGKRPASSAKLRWERSLHGPQPTPIPEAEINAMATMTPTK